MDRGNYLEAVSTSWKEQLLNNLVRLRYGDTLTSLEMTSVTTSYELDVGLTASYTKSWGATSAAAGFRDVATLGVPAPAFSYQDKPTITYVPMRGEALAKTMTEPLSPLRILKSLQTGWLANYIFPCCVKCINKWRNPSDIQFFELAEIVQDLKGRGVLRITVEEPAEPKVTKVPTDYTVTLKDKRKEDGAKPKQEKNCEEGADKKEKEDDAIGFLIVDHDRAGIEEDKDRTKCRDLKDCMSKSVDACVGREDRNNCVTEHLRDLGFEAKHAETESLKDCVSGSLEICTNSADRAGCVSEKLRDCAVRPTLEEKICRLKELLWSKDLCREEEQGSSYELKCKKCHGDPANEVRFWTCDLDRKITKAVACGHGQMHKIESMKPGDLKEIIAFIEFSRRYEVYEVVDANQKLPLDPYSERILMQTQSILQTLTALSRLIKMPDHEDRAVKLTTQQEDESGRLAAALKLKINWAVERPKNAFVAIKHCGLWFYIEEADYHSKDAFSSTEGILSMSETGTKEGVPILTLPVQ